jgi:phosphatidate cytidylyltransferase
MPDNIAPKPAGPGAAALAAAAARNLQQRVTSGIIMIAVALVLVYAGPWPFALMLLGVGLLMSWEWGHLVRGVDADLGFLVHATAVSLAVVLAVTGYPVLGVCALMAGAGVLVPMTLGQRARLSALGVFYVGLAAVALIWIRSDERYGFSAVIFLFLVVWTTDTMAFAIGRAVGGTKLWPSISPNKTWAGFVGGIVSSALAACLFSMFIDGASLLRLGLIGLGLGIVAQGGDLAESALKRAFGVKDASHLIPGHGGVMDRMDGIVAVAIAAGAVALIWNARSPAFALLIGG